MSKGVTIIEHTKPEQKQYFIEERKYASGVTRFHAMYCYAGDVVKYEINGFDNKQSAIIVIENDIAHTPIEVITYQYQPASIQL